MLSNLKLFRRATVCTLLITVFLQPLVVRAQPPEVPSAISKPPVWKGFPIAPPEAPPITLFQLQALIGGPTLVTYDGREVTLSEVTRALFATASIPACNMDSINPEQTLSVNWDQTPFWKAAAEVEKLSGQRWQIGTGNNLKLVPPGKDEDFGLNGIIALENPLVSLVLNQLPRSSIQIALKAKKGSVSPHIFPMNFSAYFDPKIKVQSSSLRAVQFETGLRKTATKVSDLRRPYIEFPPVNPGLTSQLTVPFPTAAVPGATFSRVTGILHAIVVETEEQFIVRNVVDAKANSKTVGWNQHALQGVKIDGNQMALRVRSTVAPVAGRIPDPRGQDVFANLKMLDANGREIPQLSSTITGVSTWQGEFVYNLEDSKGETLPGPYSLDWPLVTQTRSLDLPFVMRDVVVP
ncbi:hypothetical protein EON80_10630 [bacterium]|nr:MAG: hypothetical protein EON80_10630 [bacterium]